MASQSVARSESIAARHLAGLYGVGDEAGFDERHDRAPRGIDHLGFSVRLVFLTACFKLRLQRHGVAPGNDVSTSCISHCR